MEGGAEWWIGAGVFLTGVIIALGAAVAQMRRPKPDKDGSRDGLLSALDDHRETLLRHSGVIERHGDVIERHGDVLERHRQAVTASTEAIERHHSPPRRK